MIHRLTDFLQIIRWKNVGIFVLLQALLYFKFYSDLMLPRLFLVLVVVLLLWGVAGNIQNNIFDYKLDQYKDDFIPFDKKSYTLLYMLLYFVGFTILLIATSVFFSLVSLAFPALLTLYNWRLKKYPFIGNLSIALLTALAIFLPLWLSIGFADNSGYYSLLLFYVQIAFVLTLMRELVKDMEDVVVDKQFAYKTLPIISNKLAQSVLWVYIFGFGWIISRYYDNMLPRRWWFVCILSLILLAKALLSIKEKKYETATKSLKLLMLFGMLSILF